MSDQAKRDQSPRRTGPAGPQFEVKVATHYALALLAETEPFGLPGYRVREILFQRSAQGHPLDDVILSAVDAAGNERYLDVQAKRSIAFRESDENFRKVVAAIAETLKNDELGSKTQFGVAIERTSPRIENGVQEVLELARSTKDAEDFFTLLDAPGRSNKDMRAFVEAVRAELKKHGIAGADELFDILRRFQVLAFDFARPGSMAETLDRERARSLQVAGGSAGLYGELQTYLLRVDSVGGSTNRTKLVEELKSVGVFVGGAPNLSKARARLDELSMLALADINNAIDGVTIPRSQRRREIADAVEASERSVGILGPSSAGKSALLKQEALSRRQLCRVIALSPTGTPRGGWSAFRHELEVDTELETFVSDLACDGGGLLCVDGLDRYREQAQRETVVHLLRGAASVPGVKVLFSSQLPISDERFDWLPDDVRSSLGEPRYVRVDGLDDEEAAALAAEAPDLAPLLDSGHPAAVLARKPLILRRLRRATGGAENVKSEAQLALDWWKTGAHGDVEDGAVRHDRRRVLSRIAAALIAGDTVIDVSHSSASAVAGLIQDEVLSESGGVDQVRLRHELFADWIIGCYLHEDAERIGALRLQHGPDFWLARGFEIAARCISEDIDEERYPKLLEVLEGDDVSRRWLGYALLALVRSEQAFILLDRHLDCLIVGEGERAALMIRRAIAAHSRPAIEMLAGALPEEIEIPLSLAIPDHSSLWQATLWTATNFARLPTDALKAAVDLFGSWLVLSAFGEKQVGPYILEQLADLLRSDVEEKDQPIGSWKDYGSRPSKFAAGLETVTHTRELFANFALVAPAAAKRYLAAVSASEQPHRHVGDILQMPGKLATAAPSEFSTALRRAAISEIEIDRSSGGSGLSWSPFTTLDGPFILGSAGASTILDLLRADPSSGIALVTELDALAQDRHEDDDSFEICLAGGNLRVVAPWSYGWSRGFAPSTFVSKSLMAVEAWGHEITASGEPIDQAIATLINGPEISGAFLTIVRDLILTHSENDDPFLWELIASPELLALDHAIARRDTLNQLAHDAFKTFEIASGEDKKIQTTLGQAASRGHGLLDRISQLAIHVEESKLQPLRDRLQASVDRLGAWESEKVDFSDPRFLASHAVRLADRSSYQEATAKIADGQQVSGWQFVWPEAQKRWLAKENSQAVAEGQALTTSIEIRRVMSDEQSESGNHLESALSILADGADFSRAEGAGAQTDKDHWLTWLAAAAYVARFADLDQADLPPKLQEAFDRAFEAELDDHHISAFQVEYDATALAVVGLIYLSKRLASRDFSRLLLKAVAKFPASAGAAFVAHPDAAAELGDITISAARIGLQACIFPRQKSFDEEEAAYLARREECRRSIESCQNAETEWLGWLKAEQRWKRVLQALAERILPFDWRRWTEPTWPLPPARRPRRPIRRLRIGGPTSVEAQPIEDSEWPDFYWDSRAAAHWVRCVDNLRVSAPRAFKALFEANLPWLVDANREVEDADPDDLESQWTTALFKCAAHHAKDWTNEERERLIFAPLSGFSDEAFLVAAAAFLVDSDLMNIEGDSADRTYLVEIREFLWERTLATTHWRWLVQSSSGRMSIQIAPLLSAFFLSLDIGIGKKQRYTAGLSSDELRVFLPFLTKLAIEAGAHPGVATRLCEILADLPPADAFQSAFESASAWASGATAEFWSDYGIGSRIARILEEGLSDDADLERLSLIADAIGSAGVVQGESLRRAIEDRVR